MGWLRHLLRWRPDERDELVAAMQERLDSSTRAIIRSRVAPWGYFTEFEVLQRNEGGLTCTLRHDPSHAMAPVVPPLPEPSTLDLAALVARLHREHSQLCESLPWREDRGRYGTLYFVTHELAAWLECQYPLTTTIPDGSAVDDLWRSMMALRGLRL